MRMAPVKGTCSGRFRTWPVQVNNATDLSAANEGLRASHHLFLAGQAGDTRTVKNIYKKHKGRTYDLATPLDLRCLIPSLNGTRH